MARKTNFRISLILFLIAALSVYIFVEPYLIEIKKIEIVDSDIPASFVGKKIVFISDIHFGFNYSSQRLAKLVAKINNLNPDLVLLGGDYVEKKAALAAPCFKELSKIKAPLGIFGVLGNHDHWESAETIKKAMAQAGITDVDNRGFWLQENGERIRIGGVGDLWEDKQEIERVIKDVSPEDFLILLSHNPEYAEQLQTDKVDMVLSGHHHGGQFNFFNLWTFFMNTQCKGKYRTGIVQTDKTKVIISNGVGTTWLPIRFMARPDILLITLLNSPKQ